jgi:hypothetical protein
LKRLSAILLLAILLFNFYGYRLVIDYMQDHQAALLESKLDRAQYRDDELISIKTPMNLPYYTNSKNYERTYGSVQINGVVYEYVKRRVYQDTLELLCLPNKTKTDLKAAENEFFKLSIDGVPSQKESRSTHVVKIGLPDYFQELAAISIGAISMVPQKYYSSNSTYLKTDYSSICEHPPESMHTLI